MKSILVPMPRRLTSALGIACVVAFAAVPQPASAIPAKPAQWPLAFLKADDVWKLTKGAGVIVGLVDSGVSPLGDTTANLLPGADFSEGPTSTGIAHLDTDTVSHGTTMAVLIAGTAGGLGLSGLAPEAKILPARMQKSTGEDPIKITNAVDYVIAQHAKVINLSLGTSQTSDLAAAIRAAQDADIVVVAAGGNAGSSNVIIPAAYPGVIATAAVDETGHRWASSNYGPRVVLAAPGVSIPVETAGGVAKTVNGTSNSTAYITASVALVRALHPDWTAGQTIRALLATATKAGGSSGLARNNDYGYGIVNPLAALGIAAPVAKDNPLLAGAAPLAPAVPAAAAAPSVTPTAMPTATTAVPTPATTQPATPTRVQAAGPAAAKTGLLTTRRNRLLAAAGVAALVGVLLLGLNSILKRRSLRKNRSWH